MIVGYYYLEPYYGPERPKDETGAHPREECRFI
jgi:hypothetical protein